MTNRPRGKAQRTTRAGRQRKSAGLMARTAALLLATVFVCPAPAFAQGAITGNIGTTTDQDPEARMLLNADELIYNRDNNTIEAAGSVQIYYQGNVLQADSVTLYRSTGRFVARGNVRLDQPDGNVIFTDEADLTDDFAEGFVQALRVQSSLDTRFAAQSAERRNGNTTEFKKGVYDACRYCSVERSRPTWQIKARTIVHNQEKQTVSYRDARLEFLGVPIIYAPYFSHPDPTLRRKTGLLAPSAVFGDDIGYGARVPYFVDMAPNMDVTLAATPLTEQGVLLDGTFRHQVRSGIYSVSLAGIRQNSPDNFGATSGNTRYRGIASATGSFTINGNWTWGFSATAATDRSFLADYNRDASISASTNSFLYLQGLKDKNYFRTEALGFLIQQEEGTAPFNNNLQERQPIVHPVIDYSVVFDDAFFGGEFTANANSTSLTRGFTDVDGFGRIVGAEGNYTRASVNLNWRRQMVDRFGQVFTPFAYLTADAYLMNEESRVTTASFADGTSATLTDDPFVGRVMPAIGLQYSYPLVNTHSWGSQVIEPIGQIIVRPDENRVGDVPNDDAQSLIFDDSTLFEYDKFSGFDRTEGGTRANVGLKYTLQLLNGAYFSSLVGRSFHIAGQNSFEETDLVSTGSGSGLDTSSSDYVARAYINTRTGLQIGASTRIDSRDFEMNRTEIQAVGRLGPALGSLTYAFVNENDEVGIVDDLTEVQAAGSVRISKAFRAFGAIRYDIENASFVRDSLGVGYDYDDLSLSVSFSEDRSRNNSELVDRTVFVRFGLRTLGSSTFSQNVVPSD